MRKWSFVLFCLTALAGLIVWIGCEGDTGVTGVKGSKGRQGTAGYDPSQIPPVDRVFAFAVTNATENVINGRKSLYLTFDSTLRASKDTVVASKVSVPPLIDGLDGEEFEWGEQKSKMALAFLDADSALPGHTDCKLKGGVVRAAYDDENIYLQFQWQEQRITERDTAGEEVTVADVGESKEVNALSFYYKGPTADGSPNKTDTMVLRYSCDSVYVETIVKYRHVRVTYSPLCIIPGDTCECWDYLANPETTLVWWPKAGGEDRLVVFFPDEAASGWQDVAFKQFFGYTEINPATPENFFTDVWAWGAGRTKPVGVADDWSVTTAGAKPDLGQASYIDNLILKDSVPLYMNRRDPNLRTSEAGKSTVTIYPLWYFDAVPYSRYGWAVGSDPMGASSGQRIDCTIPGVVTTIPSGSRADVYAAARFDNGFWTVEMKRARKTHNGDDVQF